MLKRRLAQELTEENCTKLLLTKFSQFATNFIFFTDEKMFTVAVKCSSERIVKIS